MLAGVRDSVQRLMRELESPTIPYWKHLVVVFVVATPPAWVLAEVFNTAATAFGYSFAAEEETQRLIDSMPWLVTDLVAPVIETFLLAGLVAVIPMKRARWIVGAVCGTVSGIAHGLSNGALWVAGPTWMFFVYAVGYQAWRDASFFRAFGAAGIPHCVNNLLAALVFD
jgi:hypothetical protein